MTQDERNLHLSRCLGLDLNLGCESKALFEVVPYVTSERFVFIAVLDGIGATEQIRQLDPPRCDLPIYVLSADVLAQNKLSQDLKFDGYLTKPIKWDVLLASVEEKLKAKGVLTLKA